MNAEPRICPHCGNATAESVKTCETSQTPVELSVVIPAYNEEESLDAFYRALCASLEPLGLTWELVVVNDGSRDRTAEILQKLCQADSRVKGVVFSRNFGHQVAITAGLRHTSGRAVVTMDADLQHPPELIGEMVRLWKEGHHVVYTVRSYGNEIGFFKRFTSDLFYRVINRLSDVEQIPGAADFRLLDRRVVDQLNAMPENARYVRGLVAWLGFRQIGIPYTIAPRYAGASKYSLVKMLSLAAEAITSFSTKPLRWCMYFGFFVALAVVPYSILAIYQHFFTNQTVPGWSSLIVAISFLGAVQLISLGVLGEYIGRIYTEVKQRPLYTVQERYGFHAGFDAEIVSEYDRDAETNPPPTTVELRKAG